MRDFVYMCVCFAMYLRISKVFILNNFVVMRVASNDQCNKKGAYEILYHEFYVYIQSDKIGLTVGAYCMRISNVLCGYLVSLTCEFDCAFQRICMDCPIYHCHRVFLQIVYHNREKEKNKETAQDTSKKK